MSNYIKLFVFGLAFFMVSPLLFFDFPIRWKIQKGDITYEEKPKEIQIPNNVLYVKSTGVDLEIVVDSSSSGTYTQDSLLQIYISGDTMFIKDQAAVKEENAGEVISMTEVDESFRNIVIYLSDLNGFMAFQSSVDVKFYNYQKGKTYQISSDFGSKVTVQNLRLNNFNIREISDEPMNANLKVRLNHLSGRFSLPGNFKKADVTLVKSDVEIEQSKFAEQYRIWCDDSSEVYLPHRMIPKVKVFKIK